MLRTAKESKTKVWLLLFFLVPSIADLSLDHFYDRSESLVIDLKC